MIETWLQQIVLESRHEVFESYLCLGSRESWSICRAAALSCSAKYLSIKVKLESPSSLRTLYRTSVQGVDLTSDCRDPAGPSLGSPSWDRCLGIQSHTTAWKYVRSAGSRDAAPSTTAAEINRSEFVKKNPGGKCIRWDFVDG